jgi:hypothetical protein
MAPAEVAWTAALASFEERVPWFPFRDDLPKVRGKTAERME